MAQTTDDQRSPGPGASGHDSSAPPAQPGPSVQELLDTETRPVPAALRDRSRVALGTGSVDRERYTSYAWHRLEVERLWRRVWQMACRDEDIPEVGDHVVYDIVDDSLIVVRTAPDEVRAFHNSCLHRGTTLCAEAGRSESFVCPFHGWTWDLDGRLISIPSGWDFSHIDPTTHALPEARVGTWGGFVFVNMDVDCESFESYLENLPEQFADWPLEDRVKAVHVRKTFACNWKVALEAFIESYHVIATHPQILGSTGDANTQYDTWPAVRHVNRMITPFAVASPFVAAETSEQEVAETMLKIGTGGKPVQVDVPDGVTARAFMAEDMRSNLGSAFGADLSDYSDSEMLDAIEYYLFPNFAPWAGVLQGITYRFRPDGDDPDRCLMDIMLLRPVPDGPARPAPAPVHELGVDQGFDAAPELGGLVGILAQDASNLPRVQLGLKTSGFGRVNFGEYQESRIRHYHQTLTEYLERA
jgi:phenylpropionate dioxygenase-like ring-hydroxylating dioxygenase large terminal subunit